MKARKAKQRKAFKGVITSKDLSFKKGTPNIRTTTTQSTSASSAAVSTSTAQLLLQKQLQYQQQQNISATGNEWKPAVKPTMDGNKKKKKKRSKGIKSVPDFFTPEKGVLLLGTLRPNGISDVISNGKSASPSSSSSSSSSNNNHSKNYNKNRNRNYRGAPQAPQSKLQIASDLPNQPNRCSSAPPIVLSWQPLGSPVRRMKRAMRFVQQNTCVTQRVTVDVGGVARLVIPCFEGITTVSDLVETVRCRFPDYEITGLQQPGTNIGRHAWDSHQHRVTVQSEDRDSTNGTNDRSEGRASTSSLLDPNDFVSVAVGSDAALVAIGLKIPQIKNEDQDNNNNNNSRQPSIVGCDSMVVSPVTARELIPTTPMAAIASTNTNTTPLHERRHEDVSMLNPATTESSNFSFVLPTTPPPSNFRYSFGEDDDEAVPTTSTSVASTTPTTPVQKSTHSAPLIAEELAHKKAGSAMAMAVRDRLMLRIQSLAEKGAISVSQRGYLDQLVRSPECIPYQEKEQVSEVETEVDTEVDTETELRDNDISLTNRTAKNERPRPRKHKHRHNRKSSEHSKQLNLDTITGKSMYTPMPPGSN